MLSRTILAPGWAKYGPKATDWTAHSCPCRALPGAKSRTLLLGQPVPRSSLRPLAQAPTSVQAASSRAVPSAATVCACVCVRVFWGGGGSARQVLLQFLALAPSCLPPTPLALRNEQPPAAGRSGSGWKEAGAAQLKLPLLAQSSRAEAGGAAAGGEGSRAAHSWPQLRQEQPHHKLHTGWGRAWQGLPQAQPHAEHHRADTPPEQALLHMPHTPHTPGWLLALSTQAAPPPTCSPHPPPPTRQGCAGSRLGLGSTPGPQPRHRNSKSHNSPAAIFFFFTSANSRWYVSAHSGVTP